MKVVRPSGLASLEQIMDAVEYHSDPAAMEQAVAEHPERFAPRATSTVTSAPQCWHGDIKGPQITISNGGRTAYQASSNWNGVVATRELVEGVHRCSVKIESMSYMGNIWQAVFGLAHPSAASSVVGDTAFKDITGLVIGTGDKTAAGSIHAESFTVPMAQVRDPTHYLSVSTRETHFHSLADFHPWTDCHVSCV